MLFLFRPFSHIVTTDDATLQIMKSIPVPPVCSLRVLNMNKYNTLRALHKFWILRQTTVAYIYLVFYEGDPNDLLLDEYRIKDFYHMFLSTGSEKVFNYFLYVHKFQSLHQKSLHFLINIGGYLFLVPLLQS